MKRVIIAAEETPSSSQYTGYVRSIQSLIDDAERQADKGEVDKSLFKLDRAAEHLEILNNMMKSSGNKDFQSIYIAYKQKIKQKEDSILQKV